MSTPSTSNGRGPGKTAAGWITSAALGPILIWAIRTCLLNQVFQGGVDLNQVFQGGVDPPPPVSTSFTLPFDGKFLRWSEDGKRLLVVGAVRSTGQKRFSDYAVVDRADGRILHRGEMPHEISRAVWSPDSKQFALCSYRDATKDMAGAPPAEVIVIDAETFTARHFPTTNDQPGRGFGKLGWTPDGRCLYVEEWVLRTEPAEGEFGPFEKEIVTDVRTRCWRADWTEAPCPWPELPTALSVRLISPDNSVLVVWEVLMTDPDARSDTVRIRGPDGTVSEFPDFRGRVLGFSADGTAIVLDYFNGDPVEWRSVVDFSVQAPAKPAYSGSSRGGQYDANFRFNLSGEFSLRGTNLELTDLNTSRKKKWQARSSSVGSPLDVMLGRETISPDGERVAYFTAANHVTIWFVGDDWVNR